MKKVSPVRLRKSLTCPHCWTEFTPNQVKWVAGDPGLLGDARLGDKQQRFVPSRFDVQGNAIDVNGGKCTQIACPNCHLVIPRVLLDLPPVFLSILGAPGSGKSYFLSCMIWQMRRILREMFRVSFVDADPEANQQLTRYEEVLFLNPEPELPTALEKTETQGALYQSVRYGEHVVWYPRPFVFSARPDPDHVYAKSGTKLARAFCLYDNAGEHFLPGGDQSTTQRATQHLQFSQALIFLFDPTQHPSFRQACMDFSSDPQIQDNIRSHPQHQVLAEAGKRIKDAMGLPDGKLKTPLIVIATKHDAWKSMTGDSLLSVSKMIQPVKGGGHCLLLGAIRQFSDKLRKILSKNSPEVVNAAEGISEQVYYLPISLFRNPPVKDAKSNKLMVRPVDISSEGAELAALLALALAVPGLIPSINKSP